MKRKTIRTATLAGLVGVAGMLSVQFAEAQGLSYRAEVERSPMQYCYPEYNRYHDPLYLYKEYRYCEVDRWDNGNRSQR